jgi:hypothetical protein
VSNRNFAICENVFKNCALPDFCSKLFGCLVLALEFPCLQQARLPECISHFNCKWAGRPAESVLVYPTVDRQASRLKLYESISMVILTPERNEILKIEIILCLHMDSSCLPECISHFNGKWAGPPAESVQD